MENFSTAIWLLSGKGLSERQQRALILWAQDFRNRKQYEEDTNFKPSRPKQQTAQQRLDAVVKVATSLKISTLPRPKIEDIVLAAATDAGLDTPSYLENAEGYLLTRSGMAWYWDQYAPGPASRFHPVQSG